jgi:hypothetical protein
LSRISIPPSLLCGYHPPFYILDTPTKCLGSYNVLHPELVTVRASAWMYMGITAFAVAYTVYSALRHGCIVELSGGIIAFAVWPLALMSDHLEMVEEKNRLGIA